MQCSALTLSHVLCDDVDRFLRHYGVQLDQLLVPQFLHDLSFLQKGLRRHRAGFQGLYCNTCRTVPCSWWDIIKNVKWRPYVPLTLFPGWEKKCVSTGGDSDSPIHTSPKQPCPSLTSRRRDSLGISQASLAKPWVWGFSTGQISVRLWHNPSACSVNGKQTDRLRVTASPVSLCSF